MWHNSRNNTLDIKPIKSVLYAGNVLVLAKSIQRYLPHAFPKSNDPRKEVFGMHNRLPLNKNPSTMVKPSTEVGGSRIMKHNFTNVLTSRIILYKPFKIDHLCTQCLWRAKYLTQSINNLVIHTGQCLSTNVYYELKPFDVLVPYMFLRVDIAKGSMVWIQDELRW